MKSSAKLCETEKASLLFIGLLRPWANKLSGKGVCMKSVDCLWVMRHLSSVALNAICCHFWSQWCNLAVSRMTRCSGRSQALAVVGGTRWGGSYIQCFTEEMTSHWGGSSPWISFIKTATSEQDTDRPFQAPLKAKAPVPLAWVFKPALAELTSGQ